jgi:NitT/TauT family transport system substrate-binding protein
MTEITWADSGLEEITDLEGKKVGVWLGGNEHKLFAALTKNGLDPQQDVQVVAQPFDMNLFLNREVDAAAAMTYNELAQVLESENPDSGELFTLDELNVMKMSDLGTGALEDGIFVTEEWIADEANQDIATRFLKASFKGWIYCRDNPEKCRDIVVARGSKLGASHQLWQMNEINKLIWPSPNGIAMVDKGAWDQTVKIAQQTKNQDGDTVLTKPPEGLAYTNDYATKALAALKEEGADTTGADFKPITVTLKPGGA